MIAQIAVSAANFAIDKPYSYSVSDTFALHPGMRVMVPFGRGNRQVEGVVLSVEDGEQDGLKSVEQVLDAEPVLSDTMLRLAAFLRERYFCTFFDAIRAMLPGGLWFQSRDTYSLSEDLSWQTRNIRQADALAVLHFLQDCGGSCNSFDLLEILSAERLKTATSYLLRNKWVKAKTDFLRRTGDKTEKIVTLAVSAEEAMSFAAERPRSAALQRSVLELMCRVGSASVKDICYYTGAKPATIHRLVELGFFVLTERPVLRCKEIIPTDQAEPIVLNHEQEIAFSGLRDQLQGDSPGTALLYGVTGSGKTVVYIKLIRECLESGKQAVLLVPEIALTPQLLGLMAAHFGQLVAVLHSSLPVTERYDQWKRVRDGKARVIVGTRSAVFAPCPDLGLLILDEEQEHSYKSEMTPRYSAREVALWRGVKEHALVLLGSATPSVESMYHAQSGDYKLYSLQNRYNGKALPDVQIVDMRNEIKMGNDLSLSYIMQEALRDAADAGQQTILFLNRRGNSRSLACIACGETPECPRCSAKLTFHSANNRLMCHYCGYSVPVPRNCPKCGGTLKTVGVGTQKVQQEMQQLNPDLRVIRMDTDTVSAANPHEAILKRFQEEKVPVLIGTQMVAKGLNLPQVTLVGVLDADMSLYTDSFRAAETTFNMLTQVVGRAGRGELPGRAIIQTLVPEHKVITLAAQQDYMSFYDMEVNLRRVQKLPPFGDLIQITFSSLHEAQTLRGSMKFRDSLIQCLKAPDYAQLACDVLGPAPCPIVKVNERYRYRLTLRCILNKPVRQLIAHLLREFSKDRENRGTTAFVDVNGYD